MSGIISDNLGRSSGLIKSASVDVGLTKLATVTVSGGSTAAMTFDSTYVTSTYDTYRIIGWIKPATDDQEVWLQMLASDDSAIGTADYYWWENAQQRADNTAANQDQSDAKWQFPRDGVGNGTNEGITIDMTLYNFNQSATPSMIDAFEGAHDQYNSYTPYIGSVSALAAAQHYGVKFYWESGGNFTSGDWLTLYGIVK